jgi:hemerythrin
MPRIHKIEVADGIQWIEFSGANLKILCGSPADAVKHLMRCGLIAETEIDGTRFETGPNAILLSDTMLQGGSFANLAEFPVLQMLYRQGLLLPNHPNNSGQKPLLIGLEEQITSQLNYIHRGNYGLLSAEELQDAGYSEADAETLMRIKRHFAFGRIQPPNELLDSCVVGKGQVEIRGGVFIRRLGLNRYQFEYQGESTDVDLNLKTAKTYPSPYELDVYQKRLEYFSVIHSGEGNGWDINRPCMGSVISFQGRLYLIDAGPNLQAVLAALSASVNEIAGIFHTHSHDDHFSGLTALLKSDHKLRYYATPPVRAAVTKKLSALLSMEEGRFNSYFDVIDLEYDKWNDIDGLEVKPLMSPHPVETSVFLFRALGPDGYRTYGHFADIVSDRVLQSMVTADDKKDGISAALRDRVKADYLQKVDLKKIDIGGDLIHGDAQDFANDPSDKIIFAHTARALTPAERKIGSNPKFGTADVLIPTTQDYLRRLSYEFLQTYFPTQPVSRLQILLNNETVTFGPNDILQHEGQPVKTVLLILSGNAEGRRSEESEPNSITAGALLGELSLLDGKNSHETYRATSYVHALVLPASLYLTFAERYVDKTGFQELGIRRRWLRQTILFGEGLSYPVLNRIASAMAAEEIEDGDVKINTAAKFSLNVIESGIIKRFVGDAVVETLRAGDVFNEDQCLFGVTPRSHLISIGSSRIWHIPVTAILQVPNVRWKLYELHRRRVRLEADTR